LNREPWLKSSASPALTACDNNVVTHIGDQPSWHGAHHEPQLPSLQPKKLSEGKASVDQTVP
jgi:hypothetical protein